MGPGLCFILVIFAVHARKTRVGMTWGLLTNFLLGLVVTYCGHALKHCVFGLLSGETTRG